MSAVGKSTERVGLRLRYWIDDHRPLSAGIFAGAVLALFFVYLYSTIRSGEFRLDFVRENFPRFVRGMRLTLILSASSYALGMPLGFLTAYARISNVRILKAMAKGYVDALRGTPILVQILLWAVIIFSVTGGYRGRAILAGIIALTINTGAYQAEIFRGGFKAIQEGQVEAGRALGFTSWQIMRHVKLPQALRLITPPMTNEFIALLKASALLSFIAIVELTFEARNTMIQTFLTREPWTMAALLYLSMTVPLAKLVQFLEIKFRIPGLGMPSGTSRHAGRMPIPAAGTYETTATAHVLISRRDPIYEYFRKRMGSKT